MEGPKDKTNAEACFPKDALLEILSCLPVKPVRRFKCVSKSWLGIITDPLHRKKLPQTLEGFFYNSVVHIAEDDGNQICKQEIGNFVNLLGTSVELLVDPSFPFLKELSNIDKIFLLGSCNGLLLFEPNRHSKALRYIVANPATEQWVAMPGNMTLAHYRSRNTYLIFDPAVSSHFHVVQFLDKMFGTLVNIYSSKTRAWSCGKCDWDDLYILPDVATTFVNGRLYLALYGGQILALDLEGNTQKIILVPSRVGEVDFWHKPVYVGQSQGRLHYIYHAEADYNDDDAPSKPSVNVNMTGFDDTKQSLLIWVLEDYDTQQWVLKYTVSVLQLFGKTNHKMYTDYNVVTIHPDCNLVFLVQHWNRKLISYHMDSKEVRDLCTLENGYGSITPYVPYFSELTALEKKH